MTLYEISFLCCKMTANSAVNRNLAIVLNNWNDCSVGF